MFSLLDRIPTWIYAAILGAIIGWTIGDIWQMRALLEDMYISLEEQRRIAIAATERELERIAAKGKSINAETNPS